MSNSKFTDSFDFFFTLCLSPTPPPFLLHLLYFTYTGFLFFLLTFISCFVYYIEYYFVCIYDAIY